MMLKNILGGFGLLVISSVANALTDSHCDTVKQEVFNCKINNKYLSVCLADNNKVTYQYGWLVKPSMVLTGDAVLSSAPYAGGGEGRLRFTNGQYHYLVYSAISHGEWIDRAKGLREKSEWAGVYVLKNKSLLVNLTCDSFPRKKFITGLTDYKKEPFQSITVNK